MGDIPTIRNRDFREANQIDHIQKGQILWIGKSVEGRAAAGIGGQHRQQRPQTIQRIIRAIRDADDDQLFRVVPFCKNREARRAGRRQHLGRQAGCERDAGAAIRLCHGIDAGLIAFLCLGRWVIIALMVNLRFRYLKILAMEQTLTKPRF